MYRTTQTLMGTALLSALSLMILPGQALAATLKVKAPDGDLTLVSSPGQTSQVIWEDGSRVTLPLSPKASVSSFEASGESWYAAAIDAAPTGRRLVVLKGAGPKVKELPAPDVEDAAQLREPHVLMHGSGFAGLAWVEGKQPRQQTVRVARWTVGGWAPAQTVSPPGPGSQMALSTAFLGDGSWLLVWSAFDGTDSELLWSRFDGSRFTAPERLGEDNEVPDITPGLWATQAGALVAWSRYDGNDYRLHLARYAGLAWSAPEMVGPKGALYPTFQAGPDGPLLMYMTAAPRAWVVAELNAQGQVQRQITFETSHSERPLLRGVTAESVSLVWWDEKSSPEVVSGLTWKLTQKSTGD